MPLIVIGARSQYETQVSEEDYQFLLGFKWTFARSHKGGELIYARRSVREGSYNRTILMHHVVMERAGLVRPSDKHTADHWDGNSLNNRRDNLRWATAQQQMANQHGFRNRPIERLRAEEEIPF